MVTLARRVHPEKARWPMMVIEVGMLTCPSVSGVIQHPPNTDGTRMTQLKRTIGPGRIVTRRQCLCVRWAPADGTDKPNGRVRFVRDRWTTVGSSRKLGHR